MTIVYFYSHFAKRAGTERILVDKMNWLSNHGYDVVALTYEQGNHPFAFDLSPKVKHVDLNVRFYTLYKLNSIIRIYKEWCMKRILSKRYNAFIETCLPDIVITTINGVYESTAIAKSSYQCKRIIESHIDKRFLLKKTIANRISLLRCVHSYSEFRSKQKNAKNFDLLIALNQTDADDWAPYVQTKVITNMVRLNDDGRFSEGCSKRIIFAGRYVEQKSPFDLLAMWKLVFGRHPDWHLDLYGEGELRDSLVAEAESMQANIHIHQPSANIFERYKESSLLVLTSRYEPFGLVIAEAMSCGLPVVSFEADGPNSIITDGVDGFIVKDRNIDDFANRVCQLIEDKELRLQMGQRAIHSAQRYSADKIMPQWVELFESLTRNG